MTDKARLTIAAIITTLFLAAISTAGVLAHHNNPPNAPASPASASTAVHAPAPEPTRVHYEHGEAEQHD